MKKAVKQSTLVLILNVASAIMLLLILGMFVVSNQKNEQIDQANLNRFELTSNANRFLNGSSYLTNEVRAYAATADKTHYDNYWNEVNQLKNRDIGVKNMRDIGITAGEEGLIKQMSDISNNLIPLEEQSMEAAARGKIYEATELVYGEAYNTGVTQINGLKTQFLEALDLRVTDQIAKLSGELAVMKGVIYALVALIIAFQLLNYLLIRKKIILPIIGIQQEMGELEQGNLSSVFAMEPDTSEMGMLINSIHEMKAQLKGMIGDLSRVLSEIARGNLNVNPEVQYSGEFAALRDSLLTILQSLSKTLGRINLAADEVYSSSEQVAGGAQELSQGATEQAASVEELAATISDVTTRINENAGYAELASEKIGSVGREIQESNRRMQSMVEAISNISKSSDEIGKIIKTIEDIAFQTNILALNAAVEAARAGAAGKGFAVVADEVRDLASKSAEASKSTAVLIENSIKAVDNGTRIADETAGLLHSVVEHVGEVVETIQGISSASKEQARSITEIMTGVDQISSVVQTNSATAEESAASSEELSGQANLMKELVSRFELKR